MNDHNLEQLLRNMIPAAPSADLTERVRQDIQLADLFRNAAGQDQPTASGRRLPTWISRVSWAAMGAAAAIALSNTLHRMDSKGETPPVASIATNSLKPAPTLSSTREFVGIDDGGIVYSSDGEPGKLVSVSSIERHHWVDPKDGAEYTLEVPQEESVLVPLSFQ